MHQNFHAVGAAIGKEIGAVRLRRTEYRHYTGQRGLGAGAYVHRLGGNPDAINANHWASPWTDKTGAAFRIGGWPFHRDRLLAKR